MEMGAWAACDIRYYSLNGISLCLTPRGVHYPQSQQEYYDAISVSNDAGESTIFIEFMLSVIKASRIKVISTSDKMSDEKMDMATLRWNKIQEYIKTYEYIMNADVRKLCGVSAATANHVHIV